MSDEQLTCHLLKMMLEAALHGKPYPGQQPPAALFPDVEMVRDLDEIVILDQYLSSSCKINLPGFHLVILSAGEIEERTNSTGDFPYFSLKEVEISHDKVLMSLQLSWAVSEASKQAQNIYLGGGGVRVEYVRINEEWQVPSGPKATWMA